MSSTTTVYCDCDRHPGKSWEIATFRREPAGWLLVRDDGKKLDDDIEVMVYADTNEVTRVKVWQPANPKKIRPPAPTAGDRSGEADDDGHIQLGPAAAMAQAWPPTVVGSTPLPNHKNRPKYYRYNLRCRLCASKLGKGRGRLGVRAEHLHTILDTHTGTSISITDLAARLTSSGTS